MKSLLASAVLLLFASGARAADPTPWDTQVSGAQWLAGMFDGGVLCWTPAADFAAAAENGPLTMYKLEREAVVAGVTIYRASACPFSGVTKMGGMFMAGKAMMRTQQGPPAMLVSKDSAQLERAKKSLAYASKFLVGK